MSKIFLSLQNYENYPSQSLLEAISSGNYIIASDVGDTNSIVKTDFGSLVSLSIEDISIKLKDAIKLIEKSGDDIFRSSRNFAINRFKPEDSISYFKTLFNYYKG